MPIVADGYDLTDKDDTVPQVADFGVTISGESMEPEYPDGCVVWVKSQPSLIHGDIGVFILDGEADLRVAGKVIGYTQI